MQERIRDAVKAYFLNQKPGKLLDLPAGTGWLNDLLKGWEYWGADLYTNSKLPNFKQVDLNRDLPYEDEEFDHVACLEGLEHIENPHHSLREFARLIKPGGKLIVSTPNPLNVKSRKRYLRKGTFYGFPHLVKMPKDGDHVHISPINLSFLIAFAKKYGLDLDRVHAVKIRPSMYRFLPSCFRIKLGNAFQKKGEWMSHLSSLNVLLNDGMVISFTKR